MEFATSLVPPNPKNVECCRYPLSEQRVPGATRPSLSALISLFAFLVLASYVLLFHRLGDRDLVSSHEARAAQDAESILLDGRWDLPTLFDRRIELQKPPLYYWMVAAIASARGGDVDPVSVRLPADCSALGGVSVIALFGLMVGRMRAGAIGAFALITMLHYTWLGRVGRIDMALTFMTTVALAEFYLGYSALFGPRQGSARRWLIPAYSAVGLALLLKGPIGIVLPAAVVGVFLFLERRLALPGKTIGWIKGARQLGLWWGVPLIILIAAPWYLWVNVQTDGAFFEVFFWKHNIERGLGGGALAAHPWWFYGPRLAVDLLPWSLVLPVAMLLSIRRGWWRSDPEARFGLVWLATILLILSCSRFKRADYLLPAYPGAALFLGCMLERSYLEAAHKKWIAGGFVSLMLCYTLGWNVYLSYRQPTPATGRDEIEFASEIRRRAPSPQLILFFRTEAHALAFHVGRPIDTILEWENLDTWAARPEIYHVVMPSEYANDWQNRLKKGRLKEIARSGILGGSTHSDPLVLLRTHPEAESPVP